MSFLNFKIGGKFYPFRNDKIAGVFVSGDIGAMTSYLKAESNIGIGTESNETDFGYSPGMGYATKNGRLEVWYTIQFLKSSEQSSQSNSPGKTLHYSVVKIAYNF